MHDREPTIMKRLLERLLAARSRRDREERFSESWQAADAEMHAIERAIFRAPVETQAALERVGAEPSALRSIDDHRPAGAAARPRYEAERAG